MTAYEIWDQINHFIMDSEKNEAVCNIVQKLYYANKENEAIEYIKLFFKCDDNTANDAFKIFKEETGTPPTQEQIAHANAVAKELLNKPKCPTCTSTNIKKISMSSKAVNTVMFGFLGTKRYKTFHCNNCGYEW